MSGPPLMPAPAPFTDVKLTAAEPLLAYEDIPVLVGNMWAQLAATLAAGVQDAYVSDGPEAAIHLAWCAEACYWQARGEDTSSSVDAIVRSLAPAPLTAEGVSDDGSPSASL